jgi:hypothetical protein
MAWQYQSAVVVDDALGPPPPGGVSSDDKNAWIDLVGADEPAQAKLLDSFKDLKCADFDSLLERLTSDVAQLQALWQAHEKATLTDVGLEVLFKTEALNRRAKAQKATLVCETLRALVGDANVKAFANMKDATPHLETTDVAFVDFFLQEGESPEAALERIKNAATVLKKPKLLFFMSSIASLETQGKVRDLIRTKSAFFEVMLKSDIDDEWVRGKLKAKADAFEGNMAVQALVDNLATNVSKATDEFLAQCELLELHDLRILDSLRLEAENESLSAYLTWLFSESLAAKTRRLSGALAKQIPIDAKAISFTGQIQQGRVLFNLFSEVVFGPAQEADAPIRFGELLALSSDPNSYRLILTPACDLVRCEASKKVLCVVGAGRDFNDAKSHAGARLYSKTQHLLVDLERRTSKLLSWNIDDVQTLPVSELSGEAFKRVAVMNELYAQEVKEEVLRQLGRVGTPIDPPPAAALRASVRWKVGDQLCGEDTPSDEFLSSLLTYTEKLEKPYKAAGVVLSDAFKGWLKQKVSNSHGTTAMVSKLVNSLNAVDQVYFPLNASMSWNFNGDLWIRVASLSTAQDEAAQMKGLLEVTLWTDD